MHKTMQTDPWSIHGHNMLSPASSRISRAIAEDNTACIMFATHGCGAQLLVPGYDPRSDTTPGIAKTRDHI